ncbi:hypothetical protein AnigIFM56816_003099 [Aspergillus niger]|nr:hypothetical protein AnigIFM56816_003099 [Aspergillus niger]
MTSKIPFDRRIKNTKVTTKTQLTSALSIPQQITDSILKSDVQKPASHHPSDPPYKPPSCARQYRTSREKLDPSTIRRSPRFPYPAKGEDPQPIETDNTHDAATDDAGLTKTDDTDPTGPTAAHPTETGDAYHSETDDACDTKTDVMSMTPDEINALKKAHQRAQEKFRQTKDKCRKLKEQHRKMTEQHQRTKKQRQRRNMQEKKRNKKYRKIRELYQHAKQGVRHMEAITADTLHKYEYLAAQHGDWGCMSDQMYEEEFFRMFLSLKTWAANYAYEETTVLESLPESYKKDLVTSLDGYCAQVEMSEILSGVKLGPVFGFELVTMFLVKDCLGRFFRNPFWYIAPHPGQGTEYDEEILPEATHCGAVLFELLKDFDNDGQRALLAQSWRLWTARLCNKKVMDRPNDFAERMMSRRKLMVEAMVAQVLDHELLKPLLRPCADGKKAEISKRILDAAYLKAAELSVKLSMDDHDVEFRNLRDIVEVYDPSNTETKLNQAYYGECDNLKGHRILCMVFPAIYVCGGFATPDYRELITKADVFLEEGTTSTNNDSTEGGKN